MNDQLIENLITSFMKLTICSFLAVALYLGALAFSYQQSAAVLLPEQTIPAGYSLIG